MPIPDVPDRAVVELVAVTLAGAVAMLLTDTARLQRALSGALLFGLAIASTRLIGGLSPAFAVSAGIAVAAIVPIVTEVIGELRSGGPGPARAAAIIVATALLLGTSAWLFRAAVLGGGTITVLATAAGLLFLAAITLRLVRLLPVRLPGRPRDGVAPAPAHGALGAWAGVHVAAALVLLVVPHLHLFMLALTASLITGVEFARRRTGTPRWPLSAILALLAVILAWYLLAHVAGEQSLSMRDLPEAPYSDALQLGVALGLGLVGWSLLRLWPFSRPSRGPLAPLAGAALFVRVIAPALPSGLTHWQPLIYLLALLAALHALVARRLAGGPAVVAALAVASGNPSAAAAGLVFATLAGIVEGLELLAEGGWALNRAGKLALRLFGVAAAGLFLPAVTAGLSTEVFYTVATVATLALALAAGAAPHERSRGR